MMAFRRPGHVRAGDGHPWPHLVGQEGQLGIYTNGIFQVVKELNALPMRLAAAHDGGVWVCCGFNCFKCDDQGQCTDFGQFHPDNRGTVADGDDRSPRW